MPSAPPDTSPIEETPSPNDWLHRLKSGLNKTRHNLSTLFVGETIDDALFEELETALLISDAGVEATTYLMQKLRLQIKEDAIKTIAGVKKALKQQLLTLLTPLATPLDVTAHQPLVMMIAGVNGAGKTTTIGKLTHHLLTSGYRVTLAAGDTFRAAAREQLAVWGQRNQVTVISQEGGDPSAVAFDAVQSGQAKQVDVVMIDTAGRLGTQLHLMDELKKMKRVVAKADGSAPHEVLLVIDAGTGQNALAQIKAFDEAIGVTGLIVTKLDGTAKGGILAAIARLTPKPIYFVGVGEGLHDLQLFHPTAFVDALFDDVAS
jgi:fused signal recognition particle receptor